MDNNQDLGAFASTVPQKENDLGAFASAVPAAPSPVARIAKDAGIAAARGIVGAPEALIGLADIPTGGAIGRLAEQAGIKTKETKNILADYYSPEYKAAQEKVNAAEGFVPTVVAAAQNPSTIGNAAIESLPSMLVGGAVGRMARAGVGAAAMSPVVAGAVGEGAVSAGQTAEQVRQESPSGFLTPQQAALAAGSGALTGGINLVGGKIAQQLGIADVDTLLAGGAGQAGTKGVLRRVGEGALAEGLLQEAPQSYQEQVAQNLAQDLPATQGAANAAAQGALAGGLMGGGANIPGPITGAAAKAAPEVPGESIPIKTMDAAQARANRMATETGTPFEVVPHPTVGGSFTVVPAAEAENGKPGAGAGTENGRLPAAANAVMDAAVQPANVPANDGAGGSGLGDGGRNQPVDAGRAAGTEVQPDRVSGNPADAGLAIGANDVALPPPGGPIEAAARLAQQTAPAAPAVQQEEAPRAPQPVTLQDGRVVMPTNMGAGKINPAEPASLRMQSGFDLAAQDSANSILNDRKLSTEAQRAANNAKLGEADFQGLTIKVENPQGSMRESKPSDPNQWASLMTEHYGYIKGTKGADGAGIDVFVGANPQSEKAFVVDQNVDGKYDEHKVMLGFNTLEEAKAAYADNYQPGWQGGENISETTVESLKSWLKNGETNQPFGAAQEASQASQQGEVVPPSTPAVAEAQAANVVPPEAAVPAMMKFKSVAAALKYAKDNNINAVAVKNASGKVILAPVKPLDPTFSRQQANKDVADLNEGLKSEGVTVKPVHTLTVEQRIIQAVAEKAFGTKMTYVSDNPVFSGVAYKGKVYVSASEKQALIPVAFHEVSHFLQTADKKIAGELQDFMAGYIRQGVVADRQSMENKLAPEGRKIDRQGAVNEVLADIGGAVAVDPNFWRKMAEHDESLFRKVAYKMMQLMTKAIQIARGSHFDIDRMVTDRAAVQTAIAKAWGQYNSNRDKGVYDAKADAGTVREIAGGQQTTAARVQDPAGVRRSNRILDAASGQNNRLIPLRGLPANVVVDGKSVTFGPFAPAREAAARYRKKAGIKTLPQREYVKVDPVRAKAIAAEFEDMKHDPNDPKVKASYDAMIKETLAQYQEIKATGLKIELITGADPYGNPRNAILDVINNNHLWVYPTTSGFGGTESANVDITGNPLLAPVDEKIGDHQLVANDIFRVVHDYFGHIKEGVGFRAEGEENAWQQHATMYSDLARPAMTTETRGQNSWVNFGPYSEFNKTANGAETQYAPQKVGLMDDWTSKSGGPQFSRSQNELQRKRENIDDSKVVEAQKRLNERMDKFPPNHPLIAVGKKTLEKAQEEFSSSKPFRDWFGKSKIVDSNGRPLIVFHGGGPNIKEFKRKENGRAIWLSSSEVADTYAGNNSGSTIYPVYVSMENPMMFDAKGGTWEGLSLNNERVSTDDLAKIAEDNGNDGIIIKNLRDENTDDGGDVPSTHYAVFKSNQLKSSIGNTGAFDAANNDIRFNRNPAEALDEVRNSDPISIKPQQPDAAAPVTAVHYGKTAGLDVLSGDMNSKGIYGREQERLKYSDDPAIKRRVYFYPANEGGMPAKEGGLGINAYAVKFGNLYDAAKDPQGLRAQVKGIADPADRSNAFESAIVKAGYDGYATGKMIVALDSDVPVIFLGQQSMRFNRKQQKTEAFKAWFEGSKVVDENGKPLIVYHGTNGDFNQFETGRSTVNSTTFGNKEVQRAGIFFTPDSDFAGEFAQQEGKSKDGGNIMPSYLAIYDPFDMTNGIGVVRRNMLADKGVDISNLPEHPSSDTWKAFDGENGKKLVAVLKDRGYDGAIISEENKNGDTVKVYVAFDKSQIKSATGNAGTFDAANDDIRFNRKQEQTEAFKAWFDGSKVVNKNDDPLVVYHGTASDFSEFSKDKIVRKAAGEGFYFTSNKEQGGYSEGDGANVMPVYLDIKNPTTNPMLFKNDKSYDGLMYDLKSDPGVTHYAVREPNQIKSAIGNAGTFDATNDDIRFNRNPPEWLSQVPGMTPEIAKKVGLWVPEKTLKERFNELKQDLGKKMVQGMVDQFAPIKALDEKAYMQARLSKASDGGLEAMLMYGKLGLDKDGAITVDTKGGFIDSMKKLGGEQERFFSWVAGNRAAELKANGKENLFTDTDISALKNLNQGTTSDGKNRTTLYSDVLKDLNGFSKSILDIAEKTGLIDGAERHKWEKDFYVPFYRVLEDDGKTVGPRNLSGLTNQYAFKKLKGGQNDLNDLMQNTVMNWAHLLGASLKNQAAASTLDAAQKLGVAHNVTSSTKGSVFVLKGGKEMHYVLDDPFIADAISSLGFTGMKGAVIDLATKFKRMLSFGVTFGPTYKIRNIIRDQLQAVSANPMSLNVAKNLADGVKYSSKNNPLYAQMLAGGGLFRMGSAYEDNRAQHLKNLIGNLPQGSVLNTPGKIKEVLNKGYDAWMELGDRGETITRAAIYSQMLANGASHLEASYNTRDSMDFGLQGAWPAVRLLTQTVPFMNARMQGLYKLGRAMNDDPRRFATVLGATTIATIALMLASRDDEDWKRREEWDRDNFWWFKMGGHALRIPKPFEIGAMASIAERGLDMILDGMDAKARDRFAGRLYRIVMDNLSMNPVPQLVKPALDVYSNNDPFRSRAIESAGMEKMSKSERIGGGTTGMAIMLGKAGVLSPVQIDYMIAGYFGWLGSHLAMATEPITRPALGMPVKAERKVDDAFFVGDWVKELPSNQSRYVEEFYRQAKDVREAMADMAHYKKLGNIDKAKEILTDKKDLIMQGKKFALATTNINRLNLRIQQVQASSKMDAKQKRTEVDRLSEMRNKIAERVMK